MQLIDDAIIMDADDVEWLLRQIYTELSEFLGDGPTKLVIPLEGATVLGLTITTTEASDGMV